MKKGRKEIRKEYQVLCAREQTKAVSSSICEINLRMCTAGSFETSVRFIAPDLRGSELYIIKGPSEGTHLGIIFKFSGVFNFYKRHKPLFTLYKIHYSKIL